MPLQVLTLHTVGFGSPPIGEQLRYSPDAKLIIGDRVPTAHRAKLQALLNQCGHPNATERLHVEAVLQDVGGVLQTLDGLPSYAEATKAPVPSIAMDRAPAATAPAPVSSATPMEPPPPFLAMDSAPAATAPRKDASTDRDALMELYHGTNRPPEKKKVFGLVKKGGWRNRQGWGTSQPLREWHGVFIDGGGRVARLDLGANNLMGERHFHVRLAPVE